MENHSSTKNCKRLHGKMSRLGKKFHEEIEDIKNQKLKNGTSKDRVSTEKITNLVVRHKKSWSLIKKDIIKIQESEVEEFGYG